MKNENGKTEAFPYIGYGMDGKPNELFTLYRIDMKALFILLVIALAGCRTERSEPIKRKFLMSLDSGSSYEVIQCDSFYMQSITEADVWVDGTKMHVVSKRLNVKSN